MRMQGVADEILEGAPLARSGQKVGELVQEAISAPASSSVVRQSDTWEIAKAGGTAFPFEDLPARGSLDNVASRRWYHEQLDRIAAQLDRSASLEGQARAAHEMRNEIKLTTRDVMADRSLADTLEPPRTWEEVCEKGRERGLEGDALYEYIIASSTRSNKRVDASLGLGGRK